MALPQPVHSCYKFFFLCKQFQHRLFQFGFVEIIHSLSPLVRQAPAWHYYLFPLARQAPAWHHYPILPPLLQPGIISPSCHHYPILTQTPRTTPQPIFCLGNQPRLDRVFMDIMNNDLKMALITNKPIPILPMPNPIGLPDSSLV